MKILDAKFWAKTKIMPNGCIEWQGALNPSGYGKVRRRKVKKDLLAHRYAYYLLHGYFPVNYGCHTCDNPKCCNPEHIFDGTNSENQKDAYRKGRSRICRLDPVGQMNGNAHLTDDCVKAIIKRLPNEYNTDIAKDYGVTHSMISLIRLNKSWTHIQR